MPEVLALVAAKRKLYLEKLDIPDGWELMRRDSVVWTSTNFHNCHAGWPLPLSLGCLVLQDEVAPDLPWLQMTCKSSCQKWYEFTWNLGYGIPWTHCMWLAQVLSIGAVREPARVEWRLPLHICKICLFQQTQTTTRRKGCPKRLCHNNLNCPQKLIFSRFSIIVDSFSRCGIVVYSSFSSSVQATLHRSGGSLWQRGSVGKRAFLWGPPPLYRILEDFLHSPGSPPIHPQEAIEVQPTHLSQCPNLATLARSQLLSCQAPLTHHSPFLVD